jgi:hypothetical protein
MFLVDSRMESAREAGCAHEISDVGAANETAVRPGQRIRPGTHSLSASVSPRSYPVISTIPR